MSTSANLRLALFSPLNPVRSGISDYTEENLPYWSEFADIDVVVDGYEPSTPFVRQNHRVLTPTEFLERKDDYDGAIYQIGNNYAHCGYMVPMMKAAPGVAVIHDYSLSYLMMGLTAMQGDISSLERILARSANDGAGRTAADLVLSRIDPYEVSLAAPIVDMARGVIVHNQFSAAHLRQAFRGKRMAVISHPTPIRESRTDRSELRRKYGFGDDDRILASVSSVAYNKRLGVLVEALAALTARHANLKAIIVGQGSIGGQLRQTLTKRGLKDRIVLTGWVTAEQYLDYIDLADIVADMRYPTAGETSGSILRAIQAGKPVIVSDHGFFAELDGSFAWKIPVGADEQQEFNQALSNLLSDDDKRRSMGAAGAAYARKRLRREDAAREYMSFIRESLTARDPVTAWELPSREMSGWKRSSVSTIYRLARLGYYKRRYGWRDTLNRVLSSP